jgi:hypothetical protein
LLGKEVVWFCCWSLVVVVVVVVAGVAGVGCCCVWLFLKERNLERKDTIVAVLRVGDIENCNGGCRKVCLFVRQG